MARILRGDWLAARLCDGIAANVALLREERGVTPCLAVVLVGDDAPSALYVERKLRKAAEIGVRTRELRLPADTAEHALIDLLGALNADADVHGILIQLPLPAPLRAAALLDMIDPAKDVDGFHPVNIGRLSTGGPGLIPCTPLGVMLLLDEVVDDYRGLKAVVIGQSAIVGKPVALLLLERFCTVTVANIHTRGIADIVRQADIVVVAAGSPRLVRGDWVRPGAIVIDVGITRIVDVDGRVRTVGDAAADEMDHAAVVTPVPNGVGPMTIACLLRNTVAAASAQTKPATAPPSTTIHRENEHA